MYIMLRLSRDNFFQIMESGVELTVTRSDQEVSIITVSRKYETQVITKTVTLPVVMLSTVPLLQHSGNYNSCF